MSKNTKKTCFVIGPPIGEKGSKAQEHSDKLLNYVIREAVEPMGYVATRSSEIAVGITTDAVMRSLAQANIVIADLAGTDPSVFYEMAVRHSLGGLLIPLARVNDELPLDVQQMGTFRYDLADLDNVREAKRFITESIRKGRLENPVQLALEVESLRELQSSVSDLGAMVQNLSSLSDLIADYTRKPLRGIPEIFVTLLQTLKHARVNSRLWFVGMTLGFGSPHGYREIQDGTRSLTMEDEIRVLLPGREFDQVQNEFQEELTRIIASAPQSTIVTLRQTPDVLVERFLKPLASRNSYRKLRPEIERVAKKLKERHEEVVEDAKPSQSVHYIDSIPLQILIVEKAASQAEIGSASRACVVFHVGSQNIGSKVMESGGGELGFYTEIESVVEMFQMMTESLYHSSETPPESSVEGQKLRE